MAEDIDKDAPIRLALAAKTAFPDGSMGVKGLRAERDAGRLVVEKIANKEYTTLAAIERMRELCRVPAKMPAASRHMVAGQRAEAAIAQAATAASLTALKATFKKTSR